MHCFCNLISGSDWKANNKKKHKKESIGRRQLYSFKKKPCIKLMRGLKRKSSVFFPVIGKNANYVYIFLIIYTLPNFLYFYFQRTL